MTMRDKRNTKNKKNTVNLGKVLKFLSSKHIEIGFIRIYFYLCSFVGAHRVQKALGPLEQEYN